ncbi:hypothetical protein BTVI_72651 [Pitangus sulphuratus]|nr:hypothetical protein BTVI_72651 [Pitangus sulphuratus]
MIFTKGKYKALHLGRNNPKHQDILGPDQLGSSFAGRNLGLLVDTRLIVSQECVLVAKLGNSLLGCISKSIVSRLRERILLLCSALDRDKITKRDAAIIPIPTNCEGSPPLAEGTAITPLVESDHGVVGLRI